MLNLSRQANIINTDNIRKTKIVVFGAGSIGSLLVHGLAKTGFTNLEVWDYDVIEDGNTAPQLYGQDDIGKFKVDALAEIIKRTTGTVITTKNEKVTEQTILLPEPHTIYFCAFDSLEARLLVFNKLKLFPIMWGESRIGRFDLRYYFVDTTDDKWLKEYEETLDLKGPRDDLKCGEKTNFPANMFLSGAIIAQILNFIEGRDYVQAYIGNLLYPQNLATRVKKIKQESLDRVE